jgi:transposase
MALGVERRRLPRVGSGNSHRGASASSNSFSVWRPDRCRRRQSSIGTRTDGLGAALGDDLRTLAQTGIQELAEARLGVLDWPDLHFQTPEDRCQDAITAPLVIDGAMNGETFRAYIEQFLAPTLAPGDIVIMDNLPSHKVAGVREAIEARGASLIYPPPYSPDLNPIEQAFAKLKALLRKAAPRTVEALWTVIGEALPAFSPNECANYLANAGYRRSA